MKRSTSSSGSSKTCRCVSICVLVLLVECFMIWLWKSNTASTMIPIGSLTSSSSLCSKTNADLAWLPPKESSPSKQQQQQKEESSMVVPVKHMDETALAALQAEPTIFGGVRVRAWDPWPQEKPLPCYPADPKWREFPDRRKPSHRGFLFMREMKTGSSTAVGVHLRIARNEARRRHLPPPAPSTMSICDNRFDHTSAEEYDFVNRGRGTSQLSSFLWTTLREPTKRATSQFFHFDVSRDKREPSDRNFQSYLSHPLFTQYYVWNLGMKPIQEYPSVVDAANQILQDYDFIAVTERMDESIVVLKMLLGVPLGDVLYLAAKNKGGFDDGIYKGRCFYIVPSFVSPGMKEFFESPAWKDRTFGDVYLHQAANRSLDLTIDRLGRREFEKLLAQFRTAQALAQARCVTGPTSNFTLPCDPGGRRIPDGKTGCLYTDSGCGMDCLDAIVEELGIS